MNATNNRRAAPSLFAAAVFTAVFAVLIATAAGAAQRVVLGEYFTNLY